MFNSRRFFTIFIGLDLLIFALHFVLSGHEYLGDLFDLDKEANLPTWYSSLKFTLAAGIAFWCFSLEKGLANQETIPFRWGWLLAAVLMLAMSIDETAQIHETLTNWLLAHSPGDAIRNTFDATEESDSLLWGLLFSPLLLLIGAACFFFYYTRFKQHTSLLLVVALAVLLLAGSVILETREADILSTRGYVSSRSWNLYRLYISMEELAELLASTLFAGVHYRYAQLLLRKK